MFTHKTLKLSVSEERDCTGCKGYNEINKTEITEPVDLNAMNIKCPNKTYFIIVLPDFRQPYLCLTHFIF